MTFGADFLEGSAEDVMASGAPLWGPHRRVVSCPGGPYLVLGLGDPHVAGIDAHFGEFLTGDAAPAAVIEVRRPAGTVFQPWHGTRRQYFLDAHYEPAQVLVAGVGFLARLDLANSPQLVIWALRDDGRGFADMVENGLRILTSYRVLGLGGCLLHGAALVSADAAQIFVGRSGAGKSTLAQLSRDEGCEIVSDDVAAVLPAEGGFRLATTPFAGELRLVGRPGRSYPLVAVSRLVKGSEHHWVRLPRAAAVATLAAYAPFINADPHRGDQLLRVVQAVATAVPVGELTFGLRPGVWDTVRGIVTEGGRG